MIRRLLAALALCAAATFSIQAQAAALAAPVSVATSSAKGGLKIIAHGRPAFVLVETADLPAVRRAARDLQDDLARVAGAPAPTRADGGAPLVVVGTIGHSPTVDRLIAEGKLDASGVAGQWEGFVQQVVEDPLPGVARALVIAGADRRGAIFGAYDLSERIGVSPWTWWADVPVRVQKDLAVSAGRRVQKPVVKYRGIFINDEEPALAGWARTSFGGVNSKMYEKVFELTLRLRGNYLWPAMWGKSIFEDDPLSAQRADDYGVILGTSHHEPMMRAQKDWSRQGGGAWDYTTNRPALQAFWREGVRRMGARDSLVTIGMRGDGDEPMTQGTATTLLETIVADQRKIIGEVTGKDPSQTPQVWALYKEVQDYYDAGMRVPDDVTLLFADDNWGNIRRLPEPGKTRPGGYGVYYHFDYVGGPRNYKWINTNQIERTWEQMKLAADYGADKLWIVNVGDLKPMELPISFFLDMAWDPAAMTLEAMDGYAAHWARAQFGPAQADEIGDLLEGYTRLNARCKPELLAPDTFSLVHEREAEQAVAAWDDLEARALKVRSTLPPVYHDAFFQLVQHPIQASANLTRLYVAAGRNQLYTEQGRASAKIWGDQVTALFARDAELTRQYHEDVAGGKWRGMMSQVHIGYTGWNDPPRNTPPSIKAVATAAPRGLGGGGQGGAHPWRRRRGRRQGDLVGRGPGAHAAGARHRRRGLALDRRLPGRQAVRLHRQSQPSLAKAQPDRRPRGSGRAPGGVGRLACGAHRSDRGLDRNPRGERRACRCQGPGFQARRATARLCRGRGAPGDRSGSLQPRRGRGRRRMAPNPQSWPYPVGRDDLSLDRGVFRTGRGARPGISCRSGRAGRARCQRGHRADPRFSGRDRLEVWRVVRRWTGQGGDARS
jgi:hypothetical protein